MGVCLNVWCTGSSGLSSKVKVVGHSSQLQVKNVPFWLLVHVVMCRL